MPRLPKKLRGLIGNAGIDLIALGPGDGKVRVRLAQNMFTASASAQPSLLPSRCQSAAPKPRVQARSRYLQRRPGIFVCGIRGNFHHLPRYTQLHYTPRGPTGGVCTMLGNTVGNENEPQFFQCAFSGAALATSCYSMWTTRS